MTKILRKIAIGSIILSIMTVLPAFQTVVGQGRDAILGQWSGKLSFSGVDLRIVFNITESEEGELAATMDSPDQGAAGIPVSEITFDGDSLTIEVALAQGAYYGKYMPDSLFFDGEWRQSGFTLPLRLSRGIEIKPPDRPQEPQGPLPYIEEEVEFENHDAGITLAGTMTFPKGEGPFPAVVLISGSGPQDRDETVLGHRPFLVLSDHLTRNGIVVLRYDDRGIGQSGGDHAAATTADFATDARAAFEYLTEREETDRSLTGLIGHSEGGIIASMIAAEYDDAGFVVLLAGPGLPGSEVLLEQNIVLLRQLGASQATLDKRTEQLSEEYKLLYEEWDNERTREAIIDVSVSFLERYTPEEREQFGFNEEAVRLRAEVLTGPWFRFFMQYDPSTAIRRIGCPVLAMIGEKDLQVDPRMNLPAIEKALKEGRNKDYTVMEMPGLNHLFQTSETGNPSEYARIEETMSPTVLETVSGWIKELETGGK
jgi:fermentation-respiration switch protein FrsA (DUF1100 family)